MAGPTLAAVLRAPKAGFAGVRACEANVLPLPGAHAGRIERRLRNVDGTQEVRVISCPDRAAVESAAS